MTRLDPNSSDILLRQTDQLPDQPSLWQKLKLNCQDKLWWPRLPLLLLMIYLLWQYLLNPNFNGGFLSGINLGIHETGHLLFFWTGEFFYVAGGTITQLAVPIGFTIGFWRQKDIFGSSFALSWLATNLFGVGTYAADARAQDLPLVSVASGTTIHDWNYLLGKLHLLNSDLAVGNLFHTLGYVTLVVAILFGTLLLYLMTTSPQKYDKIS